MTDGMVFGMIRVNQDLFIKQDQADTDKDPCSSNLGIPSRHIFQNLFEKAFYFMLRKVPVRNIVKKIILFTFIKVKARIVWVNHTINVGLSDLNYVKEFRI